MKTCPHCAGKGYLGFTDDTQTKPIPDPVCESSGWVADDYQPPAEPAAEPAEPVPDPSAPSPEPDPAPEVA